MDDKEATSLRLELRGIPRTPISSVQADALVKARGFVALEGTPVAAPVTGTACAVYAVDARVVQRVVNLSRSERLGLEPPPYGIDKPYLWPSWPSVSLPRETGGRDLVIDDGTGRARVRIETAHLSLLGNWRTSLSANRVSYLSTRIELPPRPDLELEFLELTVVPGEILTVYGRATYEVDPDPRALGAAPYRVAPLRCVFVATPSSPLYLVQEHVVALDAVE